MARAAAKRIDEKPAAKGAAASRKALNLQVLQGAAVNPVTQEKLERQRHEEEQHAIIPGPSKMAVEALQEETVIDEKTRDAYRLAGMPLPDLEGGPGRPVGPQDEYVGQAFQTRRPGDVITTPARPEGGRAFAVETPGLRRVGERGEGKGEVKRLSQAEADKRAEKATKRQAAARGGPKRGVVAPMALGVEKVRRPAKVAARKSKGTARKKK